MSRLSNEQILSNIYYMIWSEAMVVLNHFMNKQKEKEQLFTLEEVKSFMKKQPNKQIKGYQKLQQLFSSIC